MNSISRRNPGLDIFEIFINAQSNFIRVLETNQRKCARYIARGIGFIRTPARKQNLPKAVNFCDLSLASYSEAAFLDPSLAAVLFPYATVSRLFV